MKKRKDLSWIKVCLGVLGITPLVLGLALYPMLPDLIPSNWGVTGEITDYMDKTLFISMMGSLPAVIIIVLIAAMKIDPLYKNYTKFKKEYYCIVIATALFMNLMFFGTVTYILGFKFDMITFVIVLVGALIAVLGYFLPFVKRNYFCGFRTPWALSDDKNWDYTNKIGGQVSVVIGILVALIGALRLDPVITFIGIMAIILIGLTFPILASYNYFKNNQKKKTN